MIDRERVATVTQPDRVVLPPDGVEDDQRASAVVVHPPHRESGPRLVHPAVTVVVLAVPVDLGEARADPEVRVVAVALFRGVSVIIEIAVRVGGVVGCRVARVLRVRVSRVLLRRLLEARGDGVAGGKQGGEEEETHGAVIVPPTTAPDGLLTGSRQRFPVRNAIQGHAPAPAGV
jgi:hypothetical protein